MRRNLLYDTIPDYLYFEAINDSQFKFSASTTANTIYYSVDECLTWQPMTNDTYTETITAGNRIYLKGKNLTPIETNDKGIGIFSSTDNFNLGGNIMSLYYWDDFEEEVNLSGKTDAFAALFYGCTTLISIENLKMPATTLSPRCYLNMFSGCSKLINAPKDLLPASEASSYCYNSMFVGCSSLVEAPDLPATILNSNCYRYMFRRCSSLEKAPSILPAAKTYVHSYDYMFHNCTSLEKAPVIMADELRGTESCNAMFSGCSKLKEVTCLATNLSGTNCTNGWLANVSSSGTFTKAASMNNWSSGYSGIPSNWTVVDYQE